MKWEKKGLIYSPDRNSWWRNNSALTPTPIILDEGVIRVYAGFRDDSGVSRIGYVDLNAEHPIEILKISKTPVLNIGLPGNFDDNGVILGHVVKREKKIYLYYIGFQLVQKVKFLAFTGLAISLNNGEKFKRYSKAPILDRNDEGLYFRAIHSIILDHNIWKAWAGVGSNWQYINNKPFPSYNIWYYDSNDGINFEQKGKKCLDFKKNEYRIGRPRVIKEKNKYKMFYTYGTLNQDYLPGYAESNDGLNWVRMDNQIGIGLSEKGWDSKHLAYPAIINYKDKVYMFYNGNDMGKNGFGYAVLKEE